MHNYIVQRVEEIARYIIDNKCTLRKAAEVFIVSKSTVHTDMTMRLPCINKELYERVREVLDINLQERHIRGGESTCLKYKIEREKENK